MPGCPICKRPALPKAQNGAFPFCNERCKQIDLGHWLDEKYRVPAGELDSGEGDEPTSLEEDS